MNTIITIARQYGSGGHEVGRRLAEKLGIRCYDRDLIAMAAQKSGMSEEVLHQADEKAASSLLYTLVMGSNMYRGNIDHFNVPINDKLFAVQADIIRELAASESCVIVGRCADYILDEHPQCIRLFLYADYENRVKTVAERLSVSDGEAREKVTKTDKRRSNYYNYYTGRKWGRLENYDLSIATDKIGLDNTVRMILNFMQMAYPEKK